MSSELAEDLDTLLAALKRMEEEKLDINHYEPGEYVNGECWVVCDPDLNAQAIGRKLSEALLRLGRHDTTGIQTVYE